MRMEFPEISSKCRIIPESAHSAYDKAAQYFNIKLRRVPVDKEFRADVKAIRRHINKNTIMVNENSVYLNNVLLNIKDFCHDRSSMFAGF